MKNKIQQKLNDAILSEEKYLFKSITRELEDRLAKYSALAIHEDTIQEVLKIVSLLAVQVHHAMLPKKRKNTVFQYNISAAIEQLRGAKQIDTDEHKIELVRKQIYSLFCTNKGNYYHQSYQEFLKTLRNVQKAMCTYMNPRISKTKENDTEIKNLSTIQDSITTILKKLNDKLQLLHNYIDATTPNQSVCIEYDNDSIEQYNELVSQTRNLHVYNQISNFENSLQRSLSNIDNILDDIKVQDVTSNEMSDDSTYNELDKKETADEDKLNKKESINENELNNKEEFINTDVLNTKEEVKKMSEPDIIEEPASIDESINSDTNTTQVDDESDDEDEDEDENENENEKEGEIIHIIKDVKGNIDKATPQIIEYKNQTKDMNIDILKKTPIESFTNIDKIRKNIHNLSELLLHELINLDSIPVKTDKIREERRKNSHELNNLLDDCDNLQKKINDIYNELEPLVRSARALNEKKDSNKKEITQDDISKVVNKDEISTDTEAKNNKNTNQIPHPSRQAPSRQIGNYNDTIENISKQNLQAQQHPQWEKQKQKQKFDIKEKIKSYEYYTYIPNLNTKDIIITLKEDYIQQIQGQRMPTSEELSDMQECVLNIIKKNHPQYNKRENIEELLLRFGAGRFGTFSTTLQIPRYVDIDSIRSTYKNNILTIILPKIKQNNIYNTMDDIQYPNITTIPYNNKLHNYIRSPQNIDTIRSLSPKYQQPQYDTTPRSSNYNKPFTNIYRSNPPYNLLGLGKNDFFHDTDVWW